MSDTTSKQLNRLRIAEVVGIVTTVVAFALTRVNVPTTVAAEGNPVARHLIATIGWTGTGLIAVVTVAGAFAVFRRVLNRAPRLIIAASALLAGINVVDVLVNVWVTVQLAPPLQVSTIAPILIATLTGLLCLRWPVHPKRLLRTSRTMTKHIAWRRVGRHSLAFAVVLTVLLFPIVGPLGPGLSDSARPVGTAEAATGTIIDDFEDGDATVKASGWSGWNKNDGAFAVQSTDPINGTHSLNMLGDGDGYGGAGEAFVTRDSNTTEVTRVEAYVNMGDQANEVNDGFNFVLDDTAGTEMAKLSFSHDGNLKAGGSSFSTWSANQDYHVIFKNINYTANTYDVTVNGASTTGVSFSNTVDFGRVYLRHDTGDSSTSINATVDNIKVTNNTYDATVDVTDANGDSIDSATVEASQSGTVQKSATTGSGGSATLSLESGTYTISASKSGYNSSETTVDLTSDTTVSLTLSETSSDSGTATPTGDKFEYTMGVCYEGQAAFDPVGAQAEWLRVESTSGWVTNVEDALTPDSITEFDQYHQTRNDVYDDNQYNVEVKTDRAHFAFAGIEMSVADPFQVFQVRVPFGEYKNIADMKEAEKEDKWESACNTPSEDGDANASTPEPTPPPEPEPADELPGELTAVGTCGLPDGAGGMKRGILVQYYDPTFQTTEISYNLSYDGMVRSGHVEFDSPQGFWQRCDAGGEGIPPDEIDDEVPTPFPNGTMPEPTPFPSPTPWPTDSSPTPYDNGTIPAPTPYPSPTPYPTPEPTPTAYDNGTFPEPTPFPTPEPVVTPTDWPEGQSPTPYDNGTVPSPTPYPDQPSDCPDGHTARTDNPPQLGLTATLENGTEVSEYNCGFDYEDPVASVNGSSEAGFSGGALIGEGAGSGAPVWLTAGPAVAAIGYAYYRRRQGGGGSGPGNAGGGRSTQVQRGGR